MSYDSDWKCPRCHTDVTDKNVVCGSCGMTKDRYIYNRMLARRLEQDTPYGNSVVDYLVRYAYGYVLSRNMPGHLAEEAVGNAMVRMVENIGKYDPLLGEFTTWATQIVKNELRSLARNDSRYHSKIAFSIDEEASGDDGDSILKIEQVIGDSLSADDLIAMEEKEQFGVMEKLARRALGRYSRYTLFGDLLEGEVFDAAVKAYKERDGIGWRGKVVNITGLSYSTLNTRIARAERTWKDWTRVRESKARRAAT